MGSRYFGLALNFGTTLAVSVLLLLLGGRWLDAKLGTTPWLMIVGVLLGIAASFKTLFDQLGELERERREKDRQ